MSLQNSETLIYPTYNHSMFCITQDSSGIAPTITNQSGGTIARSNVTLLRNSAGNYTITALDFRGPRGIGSAQATISSTVAGMISVPAISYTNNTMTATVLTFNSSGVATDFTCNVEIMGY